MPSQKGKDRSTFHSLQFLNPDQFNCEFVTIRVGRSGVVIRKKGLRAMVVVLTAETRTSAGETRGSYVD